MNTFNPHLWTNYNAANHAGTVVRRILDAHIDITSDYSDWLTIGFALATDLGETGRSLFHDVSSLYPGYDYAQCDRKYTECLRSSRGDVHIASLIKLAKDHGIDVSLSQPGQPGQPGKSGISGTSGISGISGNSGNSGNSGQPGKPGNSGQPGTSGHARKAPLNIAAIKTWLSERFVMRYNVITATTEYRPADQPDAKFQQLEDRVVNSMWASINETGMSCRRDDLWSVIQSDFVPAFHPFEAFMASLPEWNPDRDPDYIGQLAKTVHTRPGELSFDEAFKKWFVGIIPAMRHVTTNQVILTLIGRQGIYKTTWLRNLLPPELRQYFYTKTNSNRMDKDDKFTLAEFMLVCLEEIDNMKPSELNQLKAYVTLDNINERPSYGRTKVHRPHLASFCATGNNPNFLSDPTGNRRWLPFEVENIDNPYLCQVNYHGIYSQAVYLFEHGFQYWFSQEEMTRQSAHNRSFEAVNMEEELVQRNFRMPEPLKEKGVFLTATEVMAVCNTGVNAKLSPCRIGQALTKLGFKKKRLATGQGYIVVKKTDNDIKLEQVENAIDPPQTAEQTALPF